MTAEPISPPRYTTNALAWWFHDAVVHPVTGTLGLVGRLCRSPRIMAIGHHIHNATAPSNDSVADYIEAAARAGHNETAGSPYSSREQVAAYREQAVALLGYLPESWEDTVAACKGTPVASSDPHLGQRGRFKKPEIVTEVTPEALAATALAEAEAALAAFEAKSAAEHLGCGEHDARQHQRWADSPLVAQIRTEHEALKAAVEAARQNGPALSLGDFLRIGQP